MKAALAVYQTGRDPRVNLDRMAGLTARAADEGAELVLFAEAAPTGFVNTDVPAHDLALGVPVPGAVTRTFAGLSRRFGIWVASGVYERVGDCLYDSAVLLDPVGRLALHYRRIDPHWHGASAKADVYRQGHEMPTAQTPFGVVAFLICGDLFSDASIDQVGSTGAEVLLVPFARGFDSQVSDEAEWESTEKAIYAEQIRRTGMVGLLTNGFTDFRGPPSHFGGALAVDGCGVIRDSQPLHREGLLLVDIPQ